MGAVVWALSPDPLWGLSPVTWRSSYFHPAEESLVPFSSEK